ncbi:GNAT family N-acetyltransferase [Pseudobacter ginsenosidimutans]|nr:GNAT family N-acetyltransferase [Pseudobacter ginsenosidimutans]QEC44108.1 GNAT family N-acetyltransferase [Pseudobacter ginsenosidimutans]
MNNSYIFQSARLGFRNWRDTDIPPFAAMNADPVVMEFFPSTRTFEETVVLVEKFRQHFEQHGYCFFAVDRVDTGQFIGFIGLNNVNFSATFTPCVEIGWRLMQPAWGQGFATEGAQRCLQFAFDDLHLAAVLSFTALSNKRSERIMQKAGMRAIGEFAHPALPKGHPLQQHSLYRLTVSEFDRLGI